MSVFEGFDVLADGRLTMRSISRSDLVLADELLDQVRYSFIFKKGSCCTCVGWAPFR